MGNNNREVAVQLYVCFIIAKCLSMVSLVLLIALLYPLQQNGDNYSDGQNFDFNILLSSMH